MLWQSLRAPAQLRTVVIIGAQSAVLVLIAAAFFMRIPRVTGSSMSPGIDSGEVVLVDTLFYKMRSIRRGDIVAFKHDPGEPELYLKRVVATAGDRIAIVAGTVYVNGRRQTEPYVHDHDTASAAPTVVPPGAFYVLGDNRAHSDDSRRFGPATSSQIVGRAVMGLWPLHQFGTL